MRSKKFLSDLYKELQILNDWNELDREAWLMDYEENPELTIKCLIALKSSWDNGRFGKMIPSDWPK